MIHRLFFIILMTLVFLKPIILAQDDYNPYKPLHYLLCMDKPLEVFDPHLPPIIIGCEVIDCCPGCPGPEFLDLRINVQGEGLDEVLLEFENLEGQISEKTSVKGMGKWIKPNILSVKEGELIISEWKYNKDSKPPLSYPKIKLNKPYFEKIHSKLISDYEKGLLKDDDWKATEVRLEVEAYLGKYLVYEYDVFIRYDWCDLVVVRPSDRIKLDNNAGNDNAVIVVDGRKSSGCVNNQTYRATNSVAVGNFKTNQNCQSEIIVFSDDDAMYFDDNVTSWTNSYETYIANLTPNILQVPVSIWLLTNDANNTTGQRAQLEINQATFLYNTNNCGIVFNANIQDRSNNNNEVNFVGTNTNNMCSNNWINNLQNSNIYTQNQLNVYYVNGNFTGLNCIADPNIIVIGTTAQLGTLTHEIGHAFSLDHTNNTPGTPAGNLMVGGGNNRTNITEGQAFRCNVNPGSVLNTNGVRNGITRNCPHNTNNDDCPAITFDITPN